MRSNLQRETENQSEVRILMLVLLKMGVIGWTNTMNGEGIQVGNW
jgi:hypothetical protein